MEDAPLTLLHVANDYAACQAAYWGRLLVCGRSDDRYGYRVLARERESVPVVSVPNLAVDTDSLALLAWLFGRHCTYQRTGVGYVAEEAWRLAEVIYADLCMISGVERSLEAFSRQRQALDPTLTVAAR